MILTIALLLAGCAGKPPSEPVEPAPGAPSAPSTPSATPVAPPARPGPIERTVGKSRTFASGFQGPNGVAFDSKGRLYVANRATGALVRVSPDG